MWLELQREERNGKLNVDVYYRPPNLNEEEEFVLLWKDNVIIIGNFNYPDIYWADRTAHSFKARNFLNVLQDSMSNGGCPD